MLIDIYFVLKTGETYQDLGAEAIHERTSGEKKDGSSLLSERNIAPREEEVSGPQECDLCDSEVQ